MWVQEAIVDKKLTLVKVRDAVNLTDACTNALFRERIRGAVSLCLRSLGSHWRCYVRPYRVVVSALVG